jgi:choline monooxygenase
MAGAARRPRFQLPPEAYYDRGWYEREQRLLFARTFNLVGYESDLPEAGNYLVAWAGAEPVIAVRQPGGGVRAFINMCRHRGMLLSAEDGHSDGHLRCPYHGWEFALDGTLARVPQRRTQFPDLEIGDLGLIEVSVGRYGGMIFVHPGAHPGGHPGDQPGDQPGVQPGDQPGVQPGGIGPSFAEWLGDYPHADRGGPFQWPDLEPVARIRVPLRCNWKFYIENHVDIYHLWYLHETSLGMYDHRALTWWKSGLHWGCVEPRRPEEDRVRHGMLPISGLPESERPLLRANLLFPNLPVSTTETTILTYQVVPTGPESCFLDIRVRGAAGSALLDEADVLRVLRDEDGVACEQMQAVVHSAHFSVGPLAEEYERPIEQFHHDLLAFLE